MRYEMSNGRRFVLSYHSPREWGEIMEAALLKLGVQPAVAGGVRLAYEKAKPV